MAYDESSTDKEVKSLKSRFPEKPPAGIRAELDAMEQDKMNARGMKAFEGRRLAKGGMTKGYAKGGSIDGCAQRGKTKGKVI